MIETLERSIHASMGLADPTAPGRDPVEAPCMVVQADEDDPHPYTVPGALGPAIPAGATHVIACIGADALGRCIGDRCGRPLRIAALAGCSPYERLTPDRAARALLSDRGSRRGVPADVAFVVAITDVDETNRSDAAALADAVGRSVSIIELAALPARGAP